MRYGSVKHIALYYKAIPGMLRLLRQERTELESCKQKSIAEMKKVPQNLRDRKRA